jgi:hypothetical protein
MNPAQQVPSIRQPGRAPACPDVGGQTGKDQRLCSVRDQDEPTSRALVQRPSTLQAGRGDRCRDEASNGSGFGVILGMADLHPAAHPIPTVSTVHSVAEAGRPLSDALTPCRLLCVRIDPTPAPL